MGGVREDTASVDKKYRVAAVGVVIIVLVVLLITAVTGLILCHYPRVTAETAAPMDAWGSEYSEAKRMGINALYLCGAQFYCIEYVKKDMIALCMLKRGPTGTQEPAALSLSGILSASPSGDSGGVHVRLRQCGRGAGFL